jgi:hypothetical protein
MKLSSALIFTTLVSASAFMTPSPTRHTPTRKTTSIAVAAEVRPMGIPGTAQLDTDWKDLGFEFRPTKSNLRITCKNGKWGEFELCEVSLSKRARFYFCDA